MKFVIYRILLCSKRSRAYKVLLFPTEQAANEFLSSKDTMQLTSFKNFRASCGIQKVTITAPSVEAAIAHTANCFANDHMVRQRANEIVQFDIALPGRP